MSKRRPVVDWLGAERALLRFVGLAAVVASLVLARHGLLGHGWLIRAENTAFLLLACVWLQERAQVKEVLKRPCAEGEEGGQEGFEKQFVDLPYQHAVHERKVEHSLVVGVDKLHGDAQQSLRECPEFSLLNENGVVYKVTDGNYPLQLGQHRLHCFPKVSFLCLRIGLKSPHQIGKQNRQHKPQHFLSLAERSE